MASWGHSKSASWLVVACSSPAVSWGPVSRSLMVAVHSSCCCCHLAPFVVCGCDFGCAPFDVLSVCHVSGPKACVCVCACYRSALVNPAKFCGLVMLRQMWGFQCALNPRSFGDGPVGRFMSRRWSGTFSVLNLQHSLPLPPSSLHRLRCLSLLAFYFGFFVWLGLCALRLLATCANMKFCCCFV